MTLKLKSIPKNKIFEYYICNGCKNIIHCGDVEQVCDSINAICKTCKQIKNDKMYEEDCNIRLQRMKRILGDQSDDDLTTGENTLDEMSESSESGESCECETEVSDETCESDESNESEVSETNNKDDIITCEKSQKMTTKENDKTITKKLKLEFWISL